MNRSPILIPGLLSLGLYLFVALRLDASNSARDVFGFVAIFAVLFLLYGFTFWRSETFKTPSARQILVFAALFRLAMIFAGLPPGQTGPALEADLSGERVGYDTFLLYDNDIWRYLWDGHVLASGLSPYEKTPREFADDAASRADDSQAPLESALWWDIFDNISYQSYTTVYPPLAQYLFALSSFIRPGSVLVLKSLVALADLGICLILACWLGKLGRPPHYLLLYAWNPLAIKELSGSGHVDALMVLLVVTSIYFLTRRKAVGAQLSLAAATMAKIGAAALTPIVWRHSPLRSWWALPVSAAALALPLLGQMHSLIQGLSAYAQQWTFNSGPWAAVRQILEWVGVENPDPVATWITRALILAVIVWATWYSRSSANDELRIPRAVFIVLATLVLLNSAVMPWYLLWALPFAALIGNRSWCLLTGLSLLSYLVYFYRSEQSWWLWVEYGVFALFLVAELRHRSPET
ncbi:MAG: hypothetical protein P8Y44_11710 [Acidobacteriota bacterium]